MAFVGHKLRENFGPALSESFLPKTFLIIFFISKALIFLYLKVSSIKITVISFIKQITVPKTSSCGPFFWPVARYQESKLSEKLERCLNR